MINLETAKLTNAINRAKQIRPRVKMIGNRTYTVTGSRGANYTVFFAVAKDAHGRPVRMGECTCEAGRNAMPCFHLAAAAALNIAIHTMRQQAREAAKAVPVVKPVSAEEAFHNACERDAAPDCADCSGFGTVLDEGEFLACECVEFVRSIREMDTPVAADTKPIADTQPQAAINCPAHAERADSPDASAGTPADERASLIESVKAAWHRARPFAAISYAIRQVFKVDSLNALSNENLMQVRAALQR
jgi:hypothetical protein